MSEKVHCYVVLCDLEDFPGKKYFDAYPEFLYQDPHCEVQIAFWEVK